MTIADLSASLYFDPTHIYYESIQLFSTLMNNNYNELIHSYRKKINKMTKP
jgi:hypothetical protein